MMIVMIIITTIIIIPNLYTCYFVLACFVQDMCEFNFWGIVYFIILLFCLINMYFVLFMLFFFIFFYFDIIFFCCFICLFVCFMDEIWFYIKEYDWRIKNEIYGC